MVIARAIAVPWAFLQVLAYEEDYPEGHLAIGMALTVVLAVGNAAFALGLKKITDETTARVVAVASIAFDVVVSMGYVLLLTFDPTSALWAILYITILEGAILFQLRGALLVWGAITVLYSFREIWGSDRYGYDLLWNSVTFRMGVGLIVALVAGLMARDLVRERRRLAHALDEVTAIDGMRAALVSTLAHDIRNPLTSIRGAHRLLLDKHDKIETDAVRRLLLTADRQSERLQVLATDLLDLARLEQGRIDLSVEELNLLEEVHTATDYLDDGVRVEIDVPPDLTVRADPSRLQQIIMNLVSNAQTYGAPPYEIVGRRNGTEVVIEFRDHGSGVPEASRTSLFNAFGTASGKGSVGFGLSIVKAMAEAHGGSVTYRDNEPRGAIFEVSLPA